MRNWTIAFAAVGAAAGLVLASHTARADKPEPVAVFDMAFINYSQEVDYGEKNEAEHARIAMLSDYFRQLLSESGRYGVQDISPLTGRIAKQGNVFSCNECEAGLARAVGAERSFTGAVQKISVLIQTVIIRERDAQSGQVVAQYQTDIRGNTDQAWRRGLKWLVENRVLAQKKP
ncbi:DUF3280 domain-containing protein [Rhodospirillum sp. A1_3_36]|uniref:DUF3280 domain-containing protein n=1 Tax=Rhodospirillum sp. A1_3_36 TaxID=3391666 RepID=UPI0039A4D13C